MTNEVSESDVVESGSILFIHGVGLDPQLFRPIMNMLSQLSVAPLRAPYRSQSEPPPAATDGEHSSYVVRQADQLLDRLAGAQDITLVGVSGGATIVLAATTRPHPGLSAVNGVIAHEPLIGPLAPALHDAVGDSARILAGDPSDGAAAQFVQRLVGSTWATLSDAHREFARTHADVIRREVPGFAAYAPTASEISSVRVPLTITTGGLSSQRRHEAAQVMAANGATSLVISGAGHLVQWEQPTEFATLIVDEQARWKVPS